MPTSINAADALGGLSADFLEQLFADYSRDAQSVDPRWRAYFQALSRNSSIGATTAPAASSSASSSASSAPGQGKMSLAQEEVDRLVAAYRSWGHLAADIDPLGLRGVGESFWADLHPTYQLRELTIGHHGLEESDLDETFSSPLKGRQEQSLRELIEDLKRIYCGSIGYQFMHVQDVTIREWFLDRVEADAASRPWTPAIQLRALRQLIAADVFEQFIRTKFPGAKVFSIDGTESLVPLIDWCLERASEQSIDKVVIGMAHRGRLNVLTNVFHKAPIDLFRSFQDRLPQGPTGHGDVRYHLGDDVEWQSPSGRKLQLSMCFNPSHLEFVNAVAMGRVRAVQDPPSRKQGLAVLLHGDASFAGQGVVYEALNLGRLSAYDTGGVLHVVINNQIGFTTTPEEARSTIYSTDIARAVQIPVLHVNGEDLQAVVRAVDLAMDFRATFHRDIVIDLMGFRRWGHNETDEPAFTQPRLYAAIEKHRRLRETFVEEAVAAGAVKAADVDAIEQQALQYLRDQFDEAAKDTAPQPEARPQDGSATAGSTAQEAKAGAPANADALDTAVPLPKLQSLLTRLAETPADFHVHPKLTRRQDDRRKMAAGDEQVDWSTGEALAIASLAVTGHRVRLIGQDTQRGTFSQRHAVLHDVVDGHTFNIFSQLAADQAVVDVINSPLSEAAAMGYEYGYSLESPQALVAWEAQFGDFVNVAQVIIDQFLASAEDKWDQLNGLVLLLPHGFEGQGPEHSSARLERFLTLAAEDNMQIAQPSTPAQYFHLLRRQATSRRPKPLVVFTPKSLLRHRLVKSPLEELSSGQFQRVVGDSSVASASRILLCSGKIYYELLAFKQEQKRDDVAIVRIEQFYPLPDAFLRDALKGAADGTPVVWVQEEPENMGACRHWKVRFGGRLLDRFPLSYQSRDESASPATGSKAIHKHEQQHILEAAFGQRAPSANLPLTSSAGSVTS